MKWSSQSDLEKFIPMTSGLDPGHAVLPPKPWTPSHEYTRRFTAIWIAQLPIMVYMTSIGMALFAAALEMVWLIMFLRIVMVEDRENAVCKEMEAH